MSHTVHDGQASQSISDHPVGESDPHRSSQTDPSERQHEAQFGRKDDRPSKWKGAYGPGRPDPWIQMKFGVLFLIALTIWSFYVVVGRVCAPAIQGRSSQGYSVGTGVGTMIGFIILWLMFSWSYMKMVLTGPGFAKNAPQPPSNNPSMTFIPYRPPQEASQHGVMMSDSDGPDPSEFAPITNAFNNVIQMSASNQPSSSATLGVDDVRRTDGKEQRTKTGTKLDEVERPVPRVTPGPRWCRHCEINKPDRTHHCRHCGTCVMQFDHHCLWIGQCVGWANHKFFIIFNFWAALFCIYIVAFMGISMSQMDGIDGQVIGLTVCAGFFAIFTVTMFPAHVNLILTAKSTVESYAGRDQTEMENSVLHREFGFIWNDHNKRKVKRRWKEEYGGVNVDDRWKVGTHHERWTTEMGEYPLGWFLPIGRPKGDGLHYPSHVAFGPNGEWLKKRDWPRERL